MNRYFEEGNQADYINSDAIKILNEVYSISDIKTLKEKYQTLQKFYQDDRPYIGLYFNKKTVIYTRSVAGTFTPNWYSFFYNIETWYRKN